jgi:transcription elongation factor GreA
VRVRDVEGELALEIVRPEDAEAGAGRVSTESPLGRALLDRQAGDRVRVRAPGGLLAVIVLEVNG